MKKTSLHFCLLSLLLFPSWASSNEPSQNDKGQFYILHSPGYNPGMFSVFNTVLGLLEFYEQGPANSGVLVDFGRRGLYYDKDKGENWWEYYFEPIVLGNVGPGSTIIRISDEEKANFSGQACSNMSRQEANRLIQKYVKVKPHIQKKIDDFVDKNFKDQFVIGIHYRGTDKSSEAPRVPYDLVFLEIDKAIASSPNKNIKIFLATDEQKFLDALKAKYKDKVVYIDAIRSLDGKGVHNAHRKKTNNYKKGEDAVLDCLLLSKCNLMIRTASNLSVCSAYFNPEIPFVVLNQHYCDMK